MSTSNKMSGMKLGFVIAALGITGCSAAPGAEGTEACTAPPFDIESTSAAPGQQAQAIWTNSVWRNGIWQNGFWSNAIWSNGIWSNALWSNAVWSNGSWTNGIWRNGYWNNGIWKNGSGLEAQPVSLVGGELAVEASDGSVIAGADVVGGELGLMNGVRLTIASYELDESDPNLAWYTLTYEGQNICGEGTRGMFVPGVWNPEGARLTTEEVSEEAAPFTYSCSTGVIAKCVTWGYQPWVSEEASELHQTCTRLARADYCGDGVAHTENGTLIDVMDFAGIQKQSSQGEMAFEAAWGPSGAVCVNQTRYADEVVEQGPIQPSCWKDLARCANPHEGEALGATMANLSVQGQRTFCEAPARY